MMRAGLLVAIAGCLPPDHPVATAPPPDLIIGHWVIDKHVLGSAAEVGESDAFLMHDRSVDISAAGYTTPWHGNCGEAKHEQTPAVTADVSGIINVDTRALQLPPNLDEYVFTCVDNQRTPPLRIYLAGDRAMTCWNGACYSLARRR